jgi:hypothetical protein
MDGLLKWNLSKLANALQVKVSEARTYFRDGRKFSFLAEVVLAKELGMDKAETEHKPYDLIDPNTNEKWEVRCMNRTVSFAPSNMTGANRGFNIEGFMEKLDICAGYIVCDIVEFPVVPYYIVKSSTVAEWFGSQRMSRTALLTRKNFLQKMS